MAITAAQLKVDVIADTSKAEQGVSSFSKKLEGAAKTMRNVGVGMTASFTAPIAGFVAASLNMAMGFEQNMNVMQQVIGATAGEMSTLQAEALSLGATTVFSANEAADAMVELGKAGMDADDIMASIGGVLSLAAAGGVSLAEAAGLTAAALNAFGLEASESTRVADLFAATADSSSANITDLGQGMKQAGFAFHLANQPIENLAASLAVLTNVGLTGSDAGTALKNAFMRMMNPTAEATGVMNELGISFYDIYGNMEQLPDIIDMLNQAMAGLTNEQRDAALSTIFLSDGMKAMIPLMEVGKEGFVGIVEEVSEVGAATDAADARMRGLSGGIEYLTGSVQSFMTAAALPFLGTINEWVIGIADAITKFGELDPKIINMGLAFAGILAVMGPLLVAIGFIAPALAAIGLPMIALGIGAALLAAAWATNFAGIQGATATAVSAIQSQLTMLQTAASNFGTSVSAAFTKTKFPTLAELWADFKAGDFEMVATKIKDAAINLTANLNTELTISGKVDKLRESITNGINQALDAAMKFDFSGATTTFNTLRAGIQGALSTAFSGINLGSATAGLNKIRASIEGVLSTAFSGINTEKAVAGLRLLRGKVETTLTTAFSGIDFSPAKTSLEGLRAKIEQALTSTFGSFSLGTVITNIQTSMNGVRDGILSGLTTAIDKQDWAKGGATFAGMIDDLSAGIKDVDFTKIDWKGVLEGAFLTLMGPVGAAIRGITWVIGSGEFEGLKTSVKGAISEISWGDLGTAFAGLGTAITTQLGKIVADIAGDLGIKMPEMPKLPEMPKMSLVWKDASESVVTGIEELTNKITTIDWVGVGANVASALKTAVTTAVQGIGAALVVDALETDAFATKFVADVKNAFTNIQWGDLAGAVKGLQAAGIKAVNDVFIGIATELGVIDLFPNMGATISTAFDSVGSSMAIALSNAIAAARSAAGTAFDGLGEQINIVISNMVAGVRPTLGTVFESLGMAITTAIGTAVDMAVLFVSTAFTALGTAISDAINAAISAATGGVFGGGGKGGSAKKSERPPTTAATDTSLDWAAYVSPLLWMEYVKPLDWLTYVLPMAWDNFVAQLDWNSFVPSMDWESFVSPLEWGAFVTSLNWGSFVSSINWGSFISDIHWDNYIPGMNWGNYVDYLDWGRFIPAFAPPALAGGTRYAPGGMALVGERGAELVDIPRGSRVYNHRETMDMMGAGGAVVQFTGPISIGNDMDIEQLTVQIARRLNQKMR